MIDDILGIETKFTKRIDNDSWKFELLRPLEMMRRASEISSLLGDAPLSSVSAEDYNMALIIATLQLAYKSGPEWFKDKFEQKFSLFPDMDYIIELFQAYTAKEEEFQTAKKKCRHNGGGQRREVDSSISSFDEI